MTADGDPVVMDFGLAKQIAGVDPNEVKLTRDGGILGTPSYMSPEQVKGDVQAVGPATDVYSLGVMLFEMLTGNTPYTGSLGVMMLQIQTAPVPPVKEFRPDVDPRLDAVCRKAMAKEPAARFASIAEFADALGKYLKEPVAVLPPLAAPVAAPVLPAPCISWLDELQDATRPSQASKKVKRGRVGAAAKHPQKWLLLAGAAACVLLAGLAILWAAGVFKVKTADGVLVVQVNEPNAEVFVDGDRVMVSWSDGGKKAEIRVKPGARKVEVKKDGFSVDSEELTFKDGDSEVFTARLLPTQVVKADAPPEKAPTDAKKPGAPPVAGAADDDKGFVPLFNGRDLTGWKAYPDQPSDWHVENGMLVGSGKGDHGSHLYTERGDFENFHLLAEARVNDPAFGSFYFRCGFGRIIRNGYPFLPYGYAARIGDLQGHKFLTGSISDVIDNIGSSTLVTQTLHNPGEWFTLEVIAEDNHLVTKVNGTTAVDFIDEKQRHSSGHLALECWLGATRIEFRKLEIKELPLGKTAP